MPRPDACPQTQPASRARRASRAAETVRLAALGKQANYDREYESPRKKNSHAERSRGVLRATATLFPND